MLPWPLAGFLLFRLLPAHPLLVQQPEGLFKKHK